MEQQETQTQYQIPRTTIKFQIDGVQFEASGIEESQVLQTVEYITQQQTQQVHRQLKELQRLDGVIVILAMFSVLVAGLFGFTVSRYLRIAPAPTPIMEQTNAN